MWNSEEVLKNVDIYERRSISRDQLLASDQYGMAPVSPVLVIVVVAKRKEMDSLNDTLSAVISEDSIRSILIGRAFFNGTCISL